MASGVAITRSKSICPALIFSARSSKPTTSAPAWRAASALLPWANTATRRLLPVPWGSTVEPRTTWSDFLASMPRFTATSTDSLNFTVANFFRSVSASCTGYCLPGGSCSRAAFIRLPIAMLEALHVDAHAAGAARDGANCRLEIRRRDVRHLDLGDLLELLAGDLAHLVGVGRGAALLEAERLADQHGSRRGLGDESEAAVVVDRDYHRDGQGLFQLLGLGVERLAELHDVHALLTERRTHGGCRVRLACRDLQFHVSLYLLCHVVLLVGANACLKQAPRCFLAVAATCP